MTRKNSHPARKTAVFVLKDRMLKEIGCFVHRTVWQSRNRLDWWKLFKFNPFESPEFVLNLTKKGFCPQQKKQSAFPEFGIGTFFQALLYWLLFSFWISLFHYFSLHFSHHSGNEILVFVSLLRHSAIHSYATNAWLQNRVCASALVCPAYFGQPVRKRSCC